MEIILFCHDEKALEGNRSSQTVQKRNKIPKKDYFGNKLL
jgi:hypothetical protein